MVPQEHCPLAGPGNRRSLLEDIDDREAVLHLQRHEHARHERKVKVHVRFVALAKVSSRILRPLIGLREQHSVWKLCLHVSAQLAEIIMGLWQIFADSALAFVKVRDRVKTEAINAKAEPKIANLLDRFMHGRVIEI